MIVNLAARNGAEEPGGPHKECCGDHNPGWCYARAARGADTGSRARERYAGWGMAPARSQRKDDETHPLDKPHCSTPRKPLRSMRPGLRFSR